MNIKSKIRGFYLGFIIGELYIQNNKNLNSFLTDFLCGTHPLIESKNDINIFIQKSKIYENEFKKINNKYTNISKYLPIGTFFYDNLLNSVLWAKESCCLITDNSMTQASASAISLMALLAINDVPVGMWMTELLAPLSGVGVPLGSPIGTQDNLIESLNLANRMAAGLESDESYLGSGLLPHEIIGWTMFCLASSPRDFDKALKLVNTTPNPNEISGLVGGLIGARLGEERVPYLQINTRNLVLEIADLLLSKKEEFLKADV